MSAGFMMPCGTGALLGRVLQNVFSSLYFCAMSLNQLELNYVWNFLPYYPTGILSVGDYVIEAITHDEARRRLHSSLFQGYMKATLFVIFARNFWHAAKLVYARPKGAGSWCCLIQSMTGFIAETIDVSTMFPGGASCLMCSTADVTGMAISSLCVNICLLLRAYTVANHNRWLLAIGILLMLPIPGALWIFLISPTQVTTDHGCVNHYPNYLGPFRSSVDVAINFIFSAVFLQVVIEQYRVLGNRCWAKLKSDNLMYIFWVIISNLVCGVITTFKLAGDSSDMFFLVDWALTSTLLIYQHQGMRKAFNTYNGATHYREIRKAELLNNHATTTRYFVTDTFVEHTVSLKQ
ncbi:hypothetical protein BDF19DRAFT_469250 [Syncephalis fuscata]|nr:hypothetical protein BDF19DRAFT_469250 [Syncephalis fuscata]